MCQNDFVKIKLLETPVLAFIGGLLIRIYLVVRMPVWLDEKFTVKLLDHQLLQIVSGNLDSTHPPGYYVLLKLWSFISTNTSWLRLSTLLLYFFNFLLLYQIGKIFLGKKVGQLLVFTYAFSGYFLIFDWQFRMYTGLTTFILFSLYLFHGKLTTKKILASFMVNLAGLFFDYGFIIYFLPLLVWAWSSVFGKEKNNIVVRAITISTSFLMYLSIWGPHFVNHFKKGLSGIEWVKYFSNPLFFIPYFLGSHFQIIFSFIFFGLVAYGIFSNTFRKISKPSNLLLFISLTSLVTSLLISWLFVPFFHVRSLQIVGITVLFCYAKALSNLFNRNKILAYLIISIFIINAVIIMNRLPILPGEFLISLP